MKNSRCTRLAGSFKKKRLKELWREEKNKSEGERARKVRR
jgi:hypothetical protein